MDLGKNKPPVKIILVAGASASAIGKGITVSSISALLKAAGYVLTVIKIDPYLVICLFVCFSLYPNRTLMPGQCHHTNMEKFLC